MSFDKLYDALKAEQRKRTDTLILLWSFPAEAIEVE